MNCDNCNSGRILEVSAKCKDMCHATQHHNGFTSEGYSIWGGDQGGDYVQFKVCLECGKMQGEFPIDDPIVISCDDCGEPTDGGKLCNDCKDFAEGEDDNE